MSMPNKN